jgi:hypothetical protein
MIRMDVHPAGETWQTHHVHPTLSPRMVLDHTHLTQSTHSNPSRSHQQSWARPLLPRKMDPDTIHSTPTDRSTGLYPVSLSRQSLKQWGQSQPSIDDRLLGLPGIYLRHAIDTFNTCSWGQIYRSLIDTGGGYNLGGVSFPHLTPWPFHSTVLRFPSKGPARSQVIQSQQKLKWKWCETPIADPWSFDHSASTEAYIYA